MNSVITALEWTTAGLTFVLMGGLILGAILTHPRRAARLRRVGMNLRPLYLCTLAGLAGCVWTLANMLPIWQPPWWCTLGATALTFSGAYGLMRLLNQAIVAHQVREHLSRLARTADADRQPPPTITL